MNAFVRHCAEWMGVGRKLGMSDYTYTPRQALGWAEIDCPECGMDHDVSHDATHCPCGHLLTEKTLREANYYNADGECINDEVAATKGQVAS